MEKVVFKTPAGNIVGRKEHNVIRVLGVPYAKAQRFQYAEPIAPFTTDFIADKFSPAPPQKTSPVLEKVLGVDILEQLEISEDCLHLSITIPAETSDQNPYPVMVWVYGGSYVTGAGDAQVYDPKMLVEEQKVIVVNINYRLGILGFLDVFSEARANLGLTDIITAIRWVKNNIAAFGGNDNNITLFGQSAGGDAIAHLLAAENIEDLFQNVIIQSAPLGIRKKRQKMTAEMIAMARELSPNASLDAILGKQESIIVAARKFGLKGGMPFGVQYGKFPLPLESEIENIWKARAKEWNILIGYAEEETSLFAPFIPALASMRKWRLLGKGIVAYLIKKTTDVIYRKPSNGFAKMMAGANGNVYLYHVSWGAKNHFGATHTIDIPLLFGNQEIWKDAQLLQGIPWEKQYEDGKKMRAIWGQFAREGVLKNKDSLSGIIQYEKL